MRPPRRSRTRTDRDPRGRFPEPPSVNLPAFRISPNRGRPASMPGRPGHAPHGGIPLPIWPMPIWLKAMAFLTSSDRTRQAPRRIGSGTKRAMPLSGDRPLVFTVGASPAPDWGTSIQIGEALWRARLRMGLTLEEVARRAGVALKLARAIEESAFDRLPSRAAAIAVAQAYAHVVRLPKRWVAMTLSAILSRRDERTVGNPSLAVLERRTSPHTFAAPTAPTAGPKAGAIGWSRGDTPFDGAVSRYRRSCYGEPQMITAGVHGVDDGAHSIGSAPSAGTTGTRLAVRKKWSTPRAVAIDERDVPPEAIAILSSQGTAPIAR